MSQDESLRQAFLTLEVNETFTEAVLVLRDRSRLCFCHRVGERWARAEGPDGAGAAGLAGQVLAGMALFRLNAKHLDVQFADGSRWEARFRGPRPGQER
jgi:hypothetical protein